jgi:LPS-assembly protein
MQVIYKNIVLIQVFVAFATIFNISVVPNAASAKHFSISLTHDTIPVVKKDTIPTKIKDTTTIKTFNVNASKDSLDAPIDYSASDSMVILIPEEQIILYSRGTIKYKEFDVNANKIIFDQGSNILKAYALTDSTNTVIERGRFTEGQSKSQFDSLVYNMKSKKGIVTNTFTKIDEIFANFEVAKQKDSITTFAKNAIITTCNLDDPHFGFTTKRLKYINKKLFVTGFVQPIFEGVKLPIGLPFGIFPQRPASRHSGFLAPQFAVNDQLGVGLEGLGWYHVFNDYVDLTARSNLYSYGSWNVFLTPMYRKRYRYNGGLNISLQKSRANFKSDPDFSKTFTFNVGWNHTVDPKVRPGTTFTASVNAGSSKFNNFIPNNAVRNFNNQLNSSINYSKTFGTKANVSVTGSHSQNANTGDFNVNLPDVNFLYNTIYPFASKNGTSSKWYEKLGIGLQSRIFSNTKFNDTISKNANSINNNSVFNQIAKNWQWGASHSIPIALSLPSLGPFQITPGVSYEERLYSLKTVKNYNDLTKRIDTVSKKGIFTARQMSFNLNANTALFGTANFAKGKINAMRIVMRPTVGFSYTPDFNSKNFYEARTDTSQRLTRFSTFEGSGNSPIGGYKSGNINFGLDNNFEIKVRSKKDTANGGLKKVKIIDGFGLNTGYDIFKETQKLSPLSIYLRSTLFDKINMNLSGTVNPYVLDNAGYATDKYAWQNGKFKLGTLQNLQFNASTSFEGKKKDDTKKDNDKDHKHDNTQTLSLDEQQQQLEYIRSNPGEFVDFNIPWKIDLSLSVNLNNRQITENGITRTQSDITSGVTINGDVSLTQKWKIGYNGSVNINLKKVEFFTMFLSREMHCWQFNVNITPIGPQRSFNISISPKSGLLKDLKINRSRFFSN